MLIVFPLGLLSTAVIFDVLYVVTGNESLATFSFWAVLSGIIGGLLAAVFGVIDWLGLPRETRARSVGFLHGAGNVVIVGLFIVSWLLRLDDPAYLPSVAPMIIGLVGAGMALVTAWLGGELVYRLRVAVDEDAHLDAPSSLSADGVAKVKEGGVHT